MFETATWTRRNRRLFACVEEIADAVDLRISDDQHPTSEKTRAYAVVKQVGLFLLLRAAIEAFAQGYGRRLSPLPARRRRRLWSSMTPESGAGAAVFLAKATGSFLLLNPGLEAGSAYRREEVQALLDAVDAHFVLAKDDQEFIAALVANLATDLAEIQDNRDSVLVNDESAHHAYYRVASPVLARGLELACGSQRARKLPPFRSLGDVELEELARTRTLTGGTIASGDWFLVETLLWRSWAVGEAEFMGLAPPRM